MIRQVPEEFWRQLQQAVERVLMLDYDGTLAPFCVRRDEAVPYPGVREVLERLAATGRTRLVIVSGRPVAQVQALLGLQHEVELWGCHGWERLTADGEHHLEPLPERAARAMEEAGRWADSQHLGEGLEKKPVSLALHWRGRATVEAEDLARRARSAWEPLACRGGLELHAFDGGLELRCPGRDKGSAVRQVLAGLPAEAAVAYLGDDRTDEDAFRALGRRGLGVLVRDQWRASAARCWLRPPQQLLEFLQCWCDA